MTVLGHVSGLDAIVALAVPVNTALLLLLALQQARHTARSRRTEHKVDDVKTIVNGGTPADAVPGGRRRYDPPSDE